MRVPWRRALPYALIAAVALLLTLPLLLVEGRPYNVDLSGFFPLTPASYEDRFWPVWNERAGISTLQFLPALLFELPLLLAGRAMGWSMETAMKARIALVFASAGWAAYSLARYHLARSRQPRSAWVVEAASLAAALLYMANAWSVHRVFHYFLWVGYALAPFVLLAMEALLERPSIRRAMVLALVFALATTDPHNPPLLALLLAPLFLLRILQAWRARRQEVGRIVSRVALAAAAYVALSLYWILPYAYNVRYNASFGPPYVLSDQMLSILSRGGDVGSALLLTHNYLPRAALAPEGALLLPWMVAGYGIVALCLVGLALRRDLTALYFGALGAAALVLGMGDRAPFGALYRGLLFGAPWGEGLSWLFRDPYRWGGFQALAYAMLLAFALAELSALAALLPRAPRLARSAADGAPALAIVAVAILSAPATIGYMTEVYEPVVVPSEYAEANALLASTPEDTQVMWAPRVLGKTTWGGNRSLAYFDAISSERPALGPFRAHSSTFFNLAMAAIDGGRAVGPLLARAGTDVVAYHNDRNPGADDTDLVLLARAGLHETARVGGSRIEAIDTTSAQLPDTPATRHQLYDARVLRQTFVPGHADLATLTVKATRVGTPGALVGSVIDARGEVVLSGPLSLARSGEAKLSLAKGAFVPGETYTIQLRAEAANATSRYDVSVYKVDAYPQGALSTTAERASMPGDLYFEVTAPERGFLTLHENGAPSPEMRAGALVASPDDLALLLALADLPAGSLRDAPVLFVESSASARRAFQGEETWDWVVGFDGAPLDALGAALPPATLVKPFRATTNADGRLGWARGTPDFSYEGYGWPLSLSALGEPGWDFDADAGLVYTSARANLTLALPGVGEERVLYARVFESPDGGRIEMTASGAPVGTLVTRATDAGFRWREVGRIAPDATSVTMRAITGFAGVNVLAAPTLSQAQALDASVAQRLGDVTLVAAARDLPAFKKEVSLPGAGTLGAIDANVTLGANVPRAGSYALWLRLDPRAAIPTVTMDGRPLAPLGCVRDCDGPLAWHAWSAVELDARRHVLFLKTNGTQALVGTVVLSSGEPLAAAVEPVAVGERSAVSRAMTLGPSAQPRMLVFAQPYDPGWVATVGGERVRSVMTDGLTNGFLVPGGYEGEVALRYEPQAVAARGAWLAAIALALVAAGLVRRLPRAAGDEPVEEAVR